MLIRYRSKPLPLRSRAHPATATGAQAHGAVTVATVALGALALGALAIGALAIGRLTVGRARIKRLEIDELVVRRFRVPEQPTPPPKSGPDSKSYGFDEAANVSGSTQNSDVERLRGGLRDAGNEA